LEKKNPQRSKIIDFMHKKKPIPHK
jgi:hypothetical protein